MKRGTFESLVAVVARMRSQVTGSNAGKVGHRAQCSAYGDARITFTR